MASIKKISNKKGVSYKITVSCGYDITGKKLIETTTYRPDISLTPKQQEKELQQFAYEFEQRVKNGKLLEGDKITFYEFTVKWLKEYAIHQLEPTTLSGYTDYLDRHIIPSIGHYKLSEIKPIHLQEFYNSLLSDGIRTDGKQGGYSHTTVKKYHAIISTILSTAYKWQMIEYNPCDRVKPPKQDNTQQVKHFTIEQADDFLNALNLTYTANYRGHSRNIGNGTKCAVKGYTEARTIPTQFKVFFNMALFGGFRRGELVALTWDKVDFDRNTVAIDSATGYANGKVYNKAPKTKGSVRLVALPGSVMDMLRSYKKEWTTQKLLLGEKWEGDNYIFIQWNGKQMHITTPSHVFREILEKYNATVSTEQQLPYIGLHGLRHTHATLLIASNTDIKTVSARLGHAQASTTLNIYAHSLQKADAACADTLEGLFNTPKTQNKAN
jgi:integrase